MLGVLWGLKIVLVTRVTHPTMKVVFSTLIMFLFIRSGEDLMVTL